MPATLRGISSNHMFAAGTILFLAAIALFSTTKDYTRSLILAIMGTTLLMAAIIESIGDRKEIARKKGRRSAWIFIKAFLNGLTLALMIFVLAFLIYLSLMSGLKALGLLIVIYLVVAAWIIERRLKHAWD